MVPRPHMFGKPICALSVGYPRPARGRALGCLKQAELLFVCPAGGSTAVPVRDKAANKQREGKPGGGRSAPSYMWLVKLLYEFSSFDSGSGFEVVH
jgi:hypothetical protein